MNRLLYLILLIAFLFYVDVAVATPGLYGSLEGYVIDDETDQPVGHCQILLVELNRSAIADENGYFRLTNIPEGKYEFSVMRIGYENFSYQIEIEADETLSLSIGLTDKPIHMHRIDITGKREDIKAPVYAVSGKKLRQNLGLTIAETVANEPGMDQRSMGPAPARPVLRGLGGDRLLVLEDGERTGDLSGTSSDHAVVIEPMTSERIEVIRGPAALLYGSNTLGGVINVIRGYIPENLPSQSHGTLSLQGESVNAGYSSGLSLVMPVSFFAFRIDGSFRNAEDIQSPKSTLENTAITTYNGSAGISLIQKWGYMGAAVSQYDSEYGIPGGFKGGHPKGVTIKMERRHQESKGEFYSDIPWLRRIELHQNYSYYYHEELEHSGVLGVSFTVDTHKFSGIAHLNSFGIFSKGAFGIWAEHRNYRIGGLSFAPDTIQRTIAGFLYEEIQLSRITIKSAIRFDYRVIDPNDDEEGVYNPVVGLIQKREFNGLSASIYGEYYLGNGVKVGGILTRSFRAPIVEELFSQGPHLAAYSYEVGNTDLNEEYGLSTEIFLRYNNDRGKLEVAAYRNRFSNYIFLRDTGETEWSLVLPVYKYSGMDAVMYGAEGSFDWQLFKNIYASGTFSYVQGDLTDKNEPIPRIPPPKGKVELKYKKGFFTLGGAVNMAAKQDRLGEFEKPTDGYAVWDVFAQYLFSTGRFMHSIDLGIQNVGNREYRRHLSRVKSIMPEPGRNFKVLYKMYF